MTLVLLTSLYPLPTKMEKGVAFCKAINLMVNFDYLESHNHKIILKMSE